MFPSASSHPPGIATLPMPAAPAPAEGTRRVRRLHAAGRDLGEGLRRPYVWHLLAWQEIRQRYRRSVLGPLWITLSTGVLLAAMGPLYGALFDQSPGSYVPYLSMSFVIWLLIASLLTEAGAVFIGAEAMIKQVRMPLSTHVFRHVWKSLIVFAHHLAIVVVVLAVYRPPVRWTLLLAPVGVAIIALNGVWAALLLGVLAARFRDIPLIVQTLVQVAFFLTPVLWRPTDRGPTRWIAEMNPLSHFLDLVRVPLLGGVPEPSSWLAVAGVTAAGFAVALPLFARFRARIPYWV